MESILISIKKLLGIPEGYRHFDPDIIAHINAVFMLLNQLGVGPKEGFVITDEYTTWDEFLPEDEVLREVIKAYVGVKVRLQFDPPTSSALLNAMEKMAAEYEWRINVFVETDRPAKDEQL